MGDERIEQEPGHRPEGDEDTTRVERRPADEATTRVVPPATEAPTARQPVSPAPAAPGDPGVPWWMRPGGGAAAVPGGPAAALPGEDPPAGVEGSPAGGRRPRRRWPALVLAAALLLGGAGTAVLLWQPATADAVTEAAVDVRGWAGVTYRSVLTQPGVGPVTVELTSNPAGDVYGTLTRPGGGRAEYARVRGTVLLQGDQGWWQPEAEGAAKASRLVGYWVKPAAAVTAWLAPAVPPTPLVLAGELIGAGGPPPAYAEPGDQVVDGEDGRLVEWPAHRVVLSDGRDPRLLSVVPAGFADPAGVRAVPAAPGVVDQVGRGPDRLSEARNQDSLLYAPSGVDYRIPDAPVCETPRCRIPVELANGGGVEARGTVVLLEDGAEVGRRPLRLAAGARTRIEFDIANAAYVREVDEVTVTNSVLIEPLP